MYRKIIFIAINLLTLTSFAKVALLLIFAALNFIMTFFCRPFMVKELNQIEEYSLLSAMITLFSGAFYVCDVTDYLKAISFIAIILVNFAFCFSWLLSLINMAFQAHMGKLQEHFPGCTYSIVAFLITLDKTQKSINLCKYFKEVKKNYGNIRTIIINTYETSIDDSYTSSTGKKRNTVRNPVKKILKDSKFKWLNKKKILSFKNFK